MGSYIMGTDHKTILQNLPYLRRNYLAKKWKEIVYLNIHFSDKLNWKILIFLHGLPSNFN